MKEPSAPPWRGCLWKRLSCAALKWASLIIGTIKRAPPWNFNSQARRNRRQSFRYPDPNSCGALNRPCFPSVRIKQTSWYLPNQLMDLQQNHTKWYCFWRINFSLMNIHPWKGVPLRAVVCFPRKYTLYHMKHKLDSARLSIDQQGNHTMEKQQASGTWDYCAEVQSLWSRV